MDYRKLVFTWMLVSITCISQAQLGGGSLSINLDDFYKRFKNYEYSQKQGEKSDILGSPYESDEFVPGSIVTLSKQHYVGILMRFNIFSDQVEFKVPDGGIFAIGFPEIIDSIRIGNKTYIYYPYKCSFKTQKGYFKVLTPGRPALLQKMSIYLKPAEPPQPYKDRVPPAFVRTPDEFYLAFSPDVALKISGKNDFLKTLDKNRSELGQFIKKNKLKFDKPDDLVKLMEYYYSIAK